MRLFIVFLILLCGTLSSAGDEKMRMAFAFATAAEALNQTPPAPVVPPVPQPVAKTCLCSGLCECGCNDGEPCDCRGANPASASYFTTTEEDNCHPATIVTPVLYRAPSWNSTVTRPAAYSPIRTLRSPLNLFRGPLRTRGGNCSS